MKKNKCLTLSSILFLSVLYYSQAQSISGGSQQFDFIRESLRINNNSKKVSEANGSPYINEEFKALKIKGYKNNIFKGRFNAYNGQMEVNTGENTIALNKEEDYEITFIENNLIYRTYNYEDKFGTNSSNFLVVVAENEKSILLKEQKIKYYEKVLAKTPYEKDRPAKFKRTSDNYYFKFENSIKYLPTKKKDLLKVFPKNTKEIKSFLKENKISFKKEEDLIKVVSFLSTL